MPTCLHADDPRVIPALDSSRLLSIIAGLHSASKQLDDLQMAAPSCPIQGSVSLSATNGRIGTFVNEVATSVVVAGSGSKV